MVQSKVQAPVSASTVSVMAKSKLHVTKLRLGFHAHMGSVSQDSKSVNVKDHLGMVGFRYENFCFLTNSFFITQLLKIVENSNIFNRKSLEIRNGEFRSFEGC